MCRGAAFSVGGGVQNGGGIQIYVDQSDCFYSSLRPIPQLSKCLLTRFQVISSTSDLYSLLLLSSGEGGGVQIYVWYIIVHKNFEGGSILSHFLNKISKFLKFCWKFLQIFAFFFLFSG